MLNPVLLTSIPQLYNAPRAHTSSRHRPHQSGSRAVFSTHRGPVRRRRPSGRRARRRRARRSGSHPGDQDADDRRLRPARLSERRRQHHVLDRRPAEMDRHQRLHTRRGPRARPLARASASDQRLRVRGRRANEGRRVDASHRRRRRVQHQRRRYLPHGRLLPQRGRAGWSPSPIRSCSSTWR